MWKRVCRGNADIYNYRIAGQLCKRCSVCTFTNIPNCDNKITGARENNKMSANALAVNNGCIKENKGCVYLSNYQKCNFHFGSSLFSKSHKYKEYGVNQNSEKRDANILIGLTLFILCALIWANYKMDLSPYDKPAKKYEKL